MYNNGKLLEYGIKNQIQTRSLVLNCTKSRDQEKSC